MRFEFSRFCDKLERCYPGTLIYYNPMYFFVYTEVNGPITWGFGGGAYKRKFTVLCLPTTAHASRSFLSSFRNYALNFRVTHFLNNGFVKMQVISKGN